MIETAFIHIGTEKTGTTTIQDFLYRNDAALASAGYCVPTGMGRRNQTRLAAYAMKDQRKPTHLHLRYGIDGPEARREFDSGVEADFGRTMASAGTAHSVIVSSEHLQSLLRTTSELEKLKALFGRYVKNCRVIVYLRRQDEMAVSLYSTRIKAGGGTNSKVFPKPKDRLPFNYDYAGLVERLEAVFGAHALDIRLFDRAHLVEGDLIADFCAATGIDPALDLESPDSRNPSLSSLGIHFLETFNKHVPDRVGSDLNKVRRNVVEIMEENFAGQYKMVARAAAEAFYSQFREGNAVIREKYFPQLTRPTLFDEDFSAYPEAAELPEYDFEDAVEVAAALWAGASRKLRELQAENVFLRGQLLTERGDHEDAAIHFQRAVDALNTPPERYLTALEASRERVEQARAAEADNSMVVEAAGPRNK